MSKKQPVAVKDLQAKKNPKGGLTGRPLIGNGANGGLLFGNGGNGGNGGILIGNGGNGIV